MCVFFHFFLKPHVKGKLAECQLVLYTERQQFFQHRENKEENDIENKSQNQKMSIYWGALDILESLISLSKLKGMIQIFSCKTKMKVILILGFVYQIKPLSIVNLDLWRHKGKMGRMVGSFQHFLVQYFYKYSVNLYVNFWNITITKKVLISPRLLVMREIGMDS